MKNNYVIATVKSWNIDKYEDAVSGLKGNWSLITDKDELTIQRLRELSPRFIFFPHWSWVVPKAIFEEFECVCFHMTDVPYGRGGSPLQNLIVRGHTDTKLTALRMVEELDSGPVYFKEKMSLIGSAGDIFDRCAKMTYKMIEKIITEEPKPSEQNGEVYTFKRRVPEDSELPTEEDLSRVFDFIRMLDAETYPRAFLNHGELRLEFDNASVASDGSIKASVTISKPNDVCHE